MSDDWLTAPVPLQPLVANVLRLTEAHLVHVEEYVRQTIHGKRRDADIARREADKTWPSVWAAVGQMPLTDETNVFVFNVVQMTVSTMIWPTIRPTRDLKTGEEHQAFMQARQRIVQERAAIRDAIDEWTNPSPKPPPLAHHEGARPEVM